MRNRSRFDFNGIKIKIIINPAGNNIIHLNSKIYFNLLKTVTLGI